MNSEYWSFYWMTDEWLKRRYEKTGGGETANNNYIIL